MTNTVLLLDYIERSGKKKGYLAKKCGLSRNGFMNCVNNRTEFRCKHIYILCEELNINTLEEKELIFFARDGALNTPNEKAVG